MSMQSRRLRARTIRLASTHRRRGAVAVIVAVGAVTIIGFAALVVDVGLMYNAKADLQRAADAAALAGASAYFSDAALTQNTDVLADVITARSGDFSNSNETLHQATALELADLSYGRHDFANPTAPISNAWPWNSVHLTLRKTTGSTNGAIPLFFAGVFGREFTNTTVTARAAVDDRVAGYRIVRDGDFLPFTIHEDINDDRVANGPDDFGYDDHVTQSGDGIREVKLFPWKWSAEDVELYDLQVNGNQQQQNDAAGNFGTLNVGIDNQGTVGLEYQILNGISADELTDEFGTSELIFHDADGSHTYNSTGNPGLSASLRFALEERIGDVVGYFVHNDSYGSGSGAQFVISGIRFARVMAVRITGNPNNRAVVLQPVAVTNGYFIVNEYAPSAAGYMGRVYLVK